MISKTAEYTAFGQTKQVPIKVWYQEKEIESDEWDEDLWIERGEDWYALSSSNLKNKKVRVIERSVWLRCKVNER